MKHLIVLIVAAVVAVVGCGLGVAAVAGRPSRRPATRSSR